MPASPSRLAVELTFLDDALMRLVGTLDAILMVVPLGRKQMRDFVDAAGRAATERPGGVKNALADLELVIAHVSLSLSLSLSLRAAENAQPTAAAAGPNASLVGFMLDSIMECAEMRLFVR
jgi:hypothetical protein